MYSWIKRNGTRPCVRLLLLMLVGSVLTGCATPATPLPKLFWAASGASQSDACIVRADPDGTSAEMIVTSELWAPWDLEIDTAGGKLYWGDVNTNKLQRCNLDGSGLETLLSGTHPIIDGPGGLAFDQRANDLYWTDFVVDRVYRLDLDTGINHPLVSVPHTTFLGIALDLDSEQMYWADASSKSILRAKLDGRDMVTILEGLHNPRDVELDISSGHLYVADLSKGIYRASLDGGDLVLIAPGQYGGGAQYLTLDQECETIYWSEVAHGHISRIDVDGSNYFPSLVTPIGAQARGVAVIP